MALIEGLAPSAALAVGVFLALVFAEYAKVRSVSAKGFSWLAAGAVFLLLEAATSWGADQASPLRTLFPGIEQLLQPLAGLATLVGWLLMLAGSIVILLDILKK